MGWPSTRFTTIAPKVIEGIEEANDFGFMVATSQAGQQAHQALESVLDAFVPRVRTHVVT